MNYYGLVVQRGKGLGKSVLGFATANCVARIGNETSSELVGAWVVLINYNSKEYKGFSGVSKKSTDIVFETHIVDFDGDLYGEKITINLIHKIREAIIFKSLEESLSGNFRFYRYYPGEEFKKHRDGNILEEGGVSLVTILIYLNDVESGGETNLCDKFLLEKPVLVKPEVGKALMFEHTVLHSGLTLESGIKYILRTDLIYNA